jgi:SAM-dependent methyltransferase
VVDVTDDPARAVQTAWDREYAAGRYRDEAPVAFVDDVLDVAGGTTAGSPGLYVGCGNGRNYLPLIDGGLDLVGLDISSAAIAQLTTRRPQRAHRLVQGTLADLPPEQRFPLVIGIQVFQHGDRDTAHAHLRAAAARVEPGGLLAIRVNATATDLGHDHELLDAGPRGGFSITYRSGPKSGLAVHFYTDTELTELLGESFAPVVGPRLHSTRRPSPGSGQWSQWEAIWRRRTDGEVASGSV